MSETATDRNASEALAARHLRVGWWALFGFACLGLGLEVLHGFKVRFYLDVSNETRRLLWTLAHAHGVLLSLVNLAFGLGLRTSTLVLSQPGAVSGALLGATALLPGGFLLGGMVVYAGDPGFGVALVPVGGLLLLWALLQIARGARG